MRIFFMSKSNIKHHTKIMLESPYAGDVELNTKYLNKCMRDSILNHTEAPIASHKLYPNALDEDKPEERELGINLGTQLQGVVDKLVVYEDYGITSGMMKAIVNATKIGLPIEYRKIGKIEPFKIEINIKDSIDNFNKRFNEEFNYHADVLKAMGVPLHMLTNETILHDKNGTPYNEVKFKNLCHYFSVDQLLNTGLWTMEQIIDCSSIIDRRLNLG